MTFIQLLPSTCVQLLLSFKPFFLLCHHDETQYVLHKEIAIFTPEFERMQKNHVSPKTIYFRPTVTMKCHIHVGFLGNKPEKLYLSLV